MGGGSVKFKIKVNGSRVSLLHSYPGFLQGGLLRQIASVIFDAKIGLFESIHATPEAEPCISASGTMQVAKSNHASCRAEPCKFACAWLRSRVSIHWLFLQLSDMDFGPKGYLDANIPRARAHTRALLLYALSRIFRDKGGCSTKIEGCVRYMV